jgi:hypothetical protein
MKQSRQHMTSDLELVNNLNDSDFLSYARIFGRGNMNLKDYVELRDRVKSRCNRLGYAWQQGCCGTHSLVKIEYANKK